MKRCPTCDREFKDHLLFCPFDGVRLAKKSDEDKLLGQILDDKYRIEQKIGEGGMGTVYRATHVHIEYSVAIKVLHPELAMDELALERFRREARAAAQIRHPNAVLVTDFGVAAENGMAYLVMEYLEGYDLRRRIKENDRIDYSEAHLIVKQTCQALHAAHAKGIIHRDLKPDNIWLVADDQGFQRVKVLDFGIAKLKTATEMITLTGQGMIVGTPHYMSPEQCRGDDLDARSDIYSMGVIIYEMLTGEVPFKAPTPVGIVIKHAVERPHPPHEIRPDIPEPVEEVILRALEKKQGDRFESALELAAEFETALHDSGIETTRAATGPLGRPAAGKKTTPFVARTESTPGPQTQFAEMGQPTEGLGDSRTEPIQERGLETRALTDPGGYVAPRTIREQTPTSMPEPKIDLPPETPPSSQPEPQRVATPVPTPSTPMPTPSTPIPVPLESGSWMMPESGFSRVLKAARGFAGDAAIIARRHYLILLAVVAVLGVLGLALLLEGSFGTGQAPPQSRTVQPPKGMLHIPGANFMLGTNDPDSPVIARPAHSVTITPFFIDEYEVTNEDYAKFVKEKGRQPPSHWKDGTYAPEEARHPVVNVSWNDARDYAEWAGKRLPRESEWEYAARGASGLRFPWGNAWADNRANVRETNRKAPVAVGSFPDGRSPFGASDMLGNVAEWTADHLVPYPGSEIKPDQRNKIHRGGSFRDSKDEFLIVKREISFSGMKYPHVGFRCAQDTPR